MNLNNKTAIVTGGSRGIGKGIALKLASLGANIALIYAGNKDGALSTASEIENLGVKCNIYCCDVSSFTQSGDTVKQIIDDFGSVQILVNNAGVVKDGFVLSMKEDDFNKVVDTNLKGSFNMIKHTYKHFMKKKYGKIINITSVIGLCGNAGQANYASSKAGIIGLTKSVAKELATRNVTCNSIAPGYIDTEMTDKLNENIKETIVSSIPMKKTGNVEDVANAVAFLSSDLSSYITGEVIRVDGGMAM